MFFREYFHRSNGAKISFLPILLFFLSFCPFNLFLLPQVNWPISSHISIITTYNYICIWRIQTLRTFLFSKNDIFQMLIKKFKLPWKLLTYIYGHPGHVYFFTKILNIILVTEFILNFPLFAYKNNVAYVTICYIFHVIKTPEILHTKCMT